MVVRHGPLVPFKDAEPQTQADYLAGLAAQRGIDGNPAVWFCTICEQRIDGDDILIVYNVPTPIPYCTTVIAPDVACVGHGPALVPAE